MEKYPYVLFGSEPIGPIALRELEAAGYPPALVISEKGLTTDELIALTHEVKPTFFLVVGYGAILKQRLLDEVAGQVLNIHPSLLPLYRGPAPVVQTILDGAHETGVTLIEIDREVDHGPILAQERIPLRGDETPVEIYEVLIQKGIHLFLEHIDDYIQEKLDLETQDHLEATFTHFVKKEDGALDFSLPHDQLERMIRAYQPWPATYCTYAGKRLIVHKAHLEQGQLRFDEVQPESGKRMPFTAFLAGQRITPEAFYVSLSGLPA
jgi:methionyl-tRNA formyltransferase